MLWGHKGDTTRGQFGDTWGTHWGYLGRHQGLVWGSILYANMNGWVKELEEPKEPKRTKRTKGLKERAERAERAERIVVLQELID